MFSHFLGTVKEQLTSDISKTVADTLDTKFTAFSKICEKQFIEQKRDLVHLKGSVEDMDGRLGNLEQESAVSSESVGEMQDKMQALEKQMVEMRHHLNLAQRTEHVGPVIPDSSWSRAQGTPALDANPGVLGGKYSDALLRRCLKAAASEAGGSASSVQWQSVV